MCTLKYFYNCIKLFYPPLHLGLILHCFLIVIQPLSIHSSTEILSIHSYCLRSLELLHIFCFLGVFKWKKLLPGSGNKQWVPFSSFPLQDYGIWVRSKLTSSKRTRRFGISLRKSAQRIITPGPSCPWPGWRRKRRGRQWGLLGVNKVTWGTPPQLASDLLTCASAQYPQKEKKKRERKIFECTMTYFFLFSLVKTSKILNRFPFEYKTQKDYKITIKLIIVRDKDSKKQQGNASHHMRGIFANMQIQYLFRNHRSKSNRPFKGFKEKKLSIKNPVFQKRYIQK